MARPTLTNSWSRNFSERRSLPIGGNADSGPFNEFPLTFSALRSYYSYVNDFDQLGNFDTQTFEWNRFDGSASAYGAGTAIARTPDWLLTEIGAGSLSVGTDTSTGINTAINFLSDTNFGIVRLNAGGNDATGVQATRSFSGSSIASGIALDNATTTIPGSTATRYRRVAFGARFAIQETGTATQTALSISMNADENAVLSTAGAVAGNNQWGFHKALGSNTLSFLSRGSVSSLTSMGTLVPGVAGTGGTFVDVAVVAERRSASFVADLYFNNVFVSTVNTTSTSAPSGAQATYAPTMAVVNGTGCDALFDVDYLWYMSERY